MAPQSFSMIGSVPETIKSYDWSSVALAVLIAVLLTFCYFIVLALNRWMGRLLTRPIATGKVTEISTPSSHAPVPRDNQLI